MKIIPLLDSAGLEAGFHVSKNSLWSCERSAWIELEYNSLYLVPETNAMIVTSSTNSPSPLPYFNDNISELLRLGSQDLISLFQFYVRSAVACLILSTFPYRSVISSLDFPTSTSRIFKSMFYFSASTSCSFKPCSVFPLLSVASSNRPSASKSRDTLPTAASSPVRFLKPLKLLFRVIVRLCSEILLLRTVLPLYTVPCHNSLE